MPNKIRQTFSSLKIRNYRLYFIGQTVSQSGTWMQSVAQSWLVLTLTGSGTALGIVAAFQYLPILLLGPWGGIIVDRFPKRRLLFATQAASAVLALSLGILVATGYVRLWMIYLFALILGVVNTVDSPARNIFPFEMVGKEEVPNAITLNSSIVNLTRIIGPAISGILITTVGIASCFMVNGLSFFALLAALYMMNPKEFHPSPAAKKTKGRLVEGFRYVRTSSVLRNTLIMMAIVGTLSYEWSVTLPLFAQFTFRGNAGTYAALTSAMGLGAVLGGLYVASRRKTSPRQLVGAALLFGAAIIITSAAPSLELAIAGMVLVGAFSINLTSLGNVTLQLESPPEMRGRVMSLWTMAFMGSTPVGGPIVGWMGEHAGSRWSIAVGGIAGIVAALVGLSSFGKKPPQMETEEEIIEAQTAASEDTRLL